MHALMPVEAAMEPWVHFVQRGWPAFVVTVPAGQSMHWSAPSSEYLPAGHAKHSVDALLSA